MYIGRPALLEFYPSGNENVASIGGQTCAEKDDFYCVRRFGARRAGDDDLMLGAVLAALSIGHAFIGCIVVDVPSVSLHIFGWTNTKNCRVYCFPVHEEAIISS